MSKIEICSANDLIENSGICALIENGNSEQEQVAIFYIPNTEEKVFGVSNWDPCGKANVLSRGLVCSINDELMIASPLYKQHFSLKTGECLEEEESLTTYPLEFDGDTVYLLQA